jgi:hypothetical protein
MIERFIKRISKDKAVYWGSPSPAADGSNTYPAPTEINCLWNAKVKVVSEKDGKVVAIEAMVYVSQDLSDQGMLMLGTLSQLTTAQKTDPRKVSSAYEITDFVKTPSLYKKNEFNRCAIIAPTKAR